MSKEIRVTTQKIIEIAALVITSNATPGELKAATGLSYVQLANVKKSEEYATALADIRKELVDTAKNVAVGGLAKMVPEAIEAVKQQLKKHNLDAAKMVFKGVGVEQADQEAKDNSLTIILPGQKQEKVIDSNGEEVV